VQLLWYVHAFHDHSRTTLNISPLGHHSLDLTYNTHLRCVEFRFGILTNDSEDVLFAMSTLSRIGSRQLEQVAFHFSSPSWRGGRLPITEWIKTDAILASSQFSRLKDVHIYTHPDAPDVADPLALFATLLPTCHARGIISFVDPPSW
jgi:hypothetical protein